MSNLKYFREKRGLTQAQLSDYADVSIRIIQHYEQGFRDINMASAITVYRLSKALKCRMEDLLEV